jgi:hypothetical protein
MKNPKNQNVLLQPGYPFCFQRVTKQENPAVEETDPPISHIFDQSARQKDGRQPETFPQQILFPM